MQAAVLAEAPPHGERRCRRPPVPLRLVLASANPDKAKEIEAILSTALE